MANTLPKRTGPQLTRAEYEHYLTTELGVSRDIIIVELDELVMTVGTGLDEHAHGPTVVPELTQISNRHALLKLGGVLKKHLRPLRKPKNFFNRYMDLVAGGDSEITTFVAQNRPRWGREAHPAAADTRQALDFEQYAAHAYLGILGTAFSGLMSLVRPAMGTVIPQPLGNRSLFAADLASKVGATLPWRHCGVLHAAPYISDTLTRFKEVKGGHWPNVAFIHNNPFNEELARTIGQNIFNLAQRRIITSRRGLAEGVEELMGIKQDNARLRSGYGAMIMTDVHHYPADEIAAAIEGSTELLAPGGLLLVRDVKERGDGNRSPASMIDKAREVFRHDSRNIEIIMPGSTEHTLSALAMFVNPGRR